MLYNFISGSFGESLGSGRRRTHYISRLRWTLSHHNNISCISYPGQALEHLFRPSSGVSGWIIACVYMSCKPSRGICLEVVFELFSYRSWASRWRQMSFAGFRYKPRGRCRLMFLINDMGLQAFRAEVSHINVYIHSKFLPKLLAIVCHQPDFWTFGP